MDITCSDAREERNAPRSRRAIDTVYPPFAWWQACDLVRRPDVLCARLNQHNPALLKLRLGLLDVLLVAEPDAIQEVLGNATLYSHDTWDYRLLRPLIGQGLLTATGAAWQMRRKLVAPVVMSHAPRLLVASCQRAAGRLLSCLQASEKRGTPFDLHQLLLEFTLSAVSDMLLSRNLAEPDDEIGRALMLARAQVAGWRVLRMSIPFAARGAQRTLQRLQALLLSEIQRRRSSPRNDLLQRLVDVWPDSPLADRELCDEALTILFTSQISPAAVASWGCWLIEQHPDAGDRLAAEWESLGPNPALTLDALHQLPFTTAVYQETLRLFPAVWAIPRIAQTRTELAGGPVERGTQVVVLPYAVQRNPRWWPEPDQFCPDRFLTGRTQSDAAMLPFGLGVRACIGAAATRVLVLSAWRTFFSRFRFESDSTRLVTPGFAMTLQPRNGYWGCARCRKR